MHMPLDMHPNARIMAQIFEAGMQMGVNFKNDLFEFDGESLIQKVAEDYKNNNKNNNKIVNAILSAFAFSSAEDYKNNNKNVNFSQEDVEKIFKAVDMEIVNIFAGKTSDAKGFKELVMSPAIVEKVEKSIAQADSLGERSTPAFYINGKGIQGFDAPLLNKVLGEIK